MSCQRFTFNLIFFHLSETPEQTPEKDESVESKQTADNKLEEDVFNNQTEKPDAEKEPEKQPSTEKESSAGKEPSTEPRTEKEPCLEKEPSTEKESSTAEELKGTEAEKDDEKVPVEEPDTDEKSGDITSAEVIPEESTPTQGESIETPAEDKVASEASIPSATAVVTNENEVPEVEDTPETTSGEDETTSGNQALENEKHKDKDTNDNETGNTKSTEVTEESTKPEDSATEPESDDVIKSSVDQESLEDALSAKDTSF